MVRRILVSVTLAVGLAAPTLSGQQAPATPTPPLSGAQFDVVSIKPHPDGLRGSNGVRTEPDGTFMMTNAPITSILAAASPEPVYEVTSYPDWVRTERYDIIAKPAPDSHPTREQQTEMRRNLLIDRLKIAGHIEDVERTTFALVPARSDGRLGPQLKKSDSDCTPPSAEVARQAAAAGRAINQCGIMQMGPGTMDVRAITLDRLVLSLRGLAGGQVTNRTGLDGLYDVSLRFAMPNLSAARPAPDTDAPQFETALQEQLGLKLVPEKTTVKVFVIDHIERPTPN